jgi:3-oxoacyl-[acyl-carrier-protein] synthase III
VASVITGSGIAVPPNVVTNDGLGRIMDTSDEWIRSRSGVAQRRFVDPGTGSSDLAVEAARLALADAGVDVSNVDALVTATMTPDLMNPGIAPLVQRGLGPRDDACLRSPPAVQRLPVRTRPGRRPHLLGPGRHGGGGGGGGSRRVSAVGRCMGHRPRTHRSPPTPDEWTLATTHRSWSVLFGDGAGRWSCSGPTGQEPGFLGSVLHTDGATSPSSSGATSGSCPSLRGRGDAECRGTPDSRGWTAAACTARRFA